MSTRVFRALVQRHSFAAPTGDQRAALWLLWKETLENLPRRKPHRSYLHGIAAAMMLSRGIAR